MRKILSRAAEIACLTAFAWTGVPDDSANTQLEKTKFFSISGTYRLRGEVQDEFDIRAYGTGTRENYLLSRLRLEVDWRLTSQFRLHAQVQDARTLGLSFSDQDFDGRNSPYHDPFDINQLYFDFRPSKMVGLRIGRQPISYGDRRVFGPGDWGNTGRYVWDAVRIEIDEKSFSSHWLFGRYVLHDPDRWPNAHAGGPTAYAFYNSVKNLPFNLDLYYVYKHDGGGSIKGERGSGDLSSHSAGFRIEGQGGRWDYSAMAGRSRSCYRSGRSSTSKSSTP